MLRLFTRAAYLTVGFCDRCSSVCTAGRCRVTILAPAREKATAHGGRPL